MAICKIMATLGLCLSLLSAHGEETVPAGASDYPSRPVRIVIGFPPGGPTDLMARLFAQRLGETMKGSFIVDNKPGAGSTIATDYVAKAKPDGYTLLLGTLAGQGIAPSLYKSLGYDPIKDLAPISLLTMVPSVLVVKPSLPIHSVLELIKYAQDNPGRLNYASTGNGTSQDMAAALFNWLAKVNTVGVNYRGSGPAIVDLLAGQTDLMFDNISSLGPYIQSGKLRPLAVTSTQRLSTLPDVPTMQEEGVKGYEIVSWFGLLAPAGTPPAIVEKIARAGSEFLRKPEVIRQLAELNAVPVGSTPAQFDEKIKSEIPKWAAVVKSAGMKVE